MTKPKQFLLGIAFAIVSGILLVAPAAWAHGQMNGQDLAAEIIARVDAEVKRDMKMIAPPPPAPPAAVNHVQGAEPEPAPPPPPPAPAPAPASAPASGSGHAGGRLACIRSYEQGGAGYASNTGNGYYGAYQFSPPTWRSVGGRGLAHQASPGEQDMRAQMLYDRDGIGQWGKPAQANCSRPPFRHKGQK